MTKAKPATVIVDAGLPAWVLHTIIGILFAGIVTIGVYVWNNREADSAETLASITERVTRANDRQIELDRRLTVLETEFRIHQGTGK